MTPTQEELELWEHECWEHLMCASMDAEDLGIPIAAQDDPDCNNMTGLSLQDLHQINEFGGYVDRYLTHHDVEGVHRFVVVWAPASLNGAGYVLSAHAGFAYRERAPVRPEEQLLAAGWTLSSYGSWQRPVSELIAEGWNFDGDGTLQPPPLPAPDYEPY